MRFGLGAVVAGAVVIVGVFGGGAAAAGPDFTGTTYEKAAEIIKSWKETPVIASVIGDQLATNDCIVTSSAQSINLDSSGRARAGAILLHLNCNESLAAPGVPGYSAASPQGRAAKKQLADLEWFNGHPQACADNFDYCKTLCKQYASQCSTATQNSVA